MFSSKIFSIINFFSKSSIYFPISISSITYTYIFISFFNLINMKGICATLMILGILLIYNNVPKRKVISFLGIHLMNIWLIHCIFFEEYTREIFQPIVYVLKNPILVVISILFVCTLISIMIKKSKILLIIIWKNKIYKKMI